MIAPWLLDFCTRIKDRIDMATDTAADTGWKPCPFCGGLDIRHNVHVGAGMGPEHRGQDVHTMCCYNCGAQFPGAYSLELLRDKWNRRPETSAASPLTDGERIFFDTIEIEGLATGGQYRMHLSKGGVRVIHDEPDHCVVGFVRTFGPLDGSIRIVEGNA